MDDYTKKQWNQCGWAGPKCHCCNPYRGKSKKQLNRLARAGLKSDDVREVKKADVDRGEDIIFRDEFWG